MFQITVKGKATRFSTLEAAKECAQTIFNKTGVIVGIDEVIITPKTETNQGISDSRRAPRLPCRTNRHYSGKTGVALMNPHIDSLERQKELIRLKWRLRARLDALFIGRYYDHSIEPAAYISLLNRIYDIIARIDMRLARAANAE